MQHKETTKIVTMKQVTVMTNSSDERISALIDGELDEQAHHGIVDELLKKGEARATWARYHLISDTLKQNLPTGIDKQFSSRVMDALQNEPTVLAPPAPQGLQFGRRLAGLAVAASVAAVAVLGVQFMYQEEGRAPAGQMAQAPSNASPSNVSPKASVANQSFARAAITPNIQTVTQSMNPPTRTPSLSQQLVQQHPSQLANRIPPNLNKYLVDHNQQSARMAVQGVVPYARIVADPNAHYIVIQTQK